MAKTEKGHGSEKEITPLGLLKAFEDYSEHVKANPKIQEVPNTKTNSVIQIKKEIPLTKTGFILYLRNEGITGNGNEILYNRDNRYDEFAKVNQFIDDTCYHDCLVGGMAGVFNHSLVARKLGLSEKQEIKQEQKVQIDWNED